jgi:hypothetical protein
MLDSDLSLGGILRYGQQCSSSCPWQRAKVDNIQQGVSTYRSIGPHTHILLAQASSLHILSHPLVRFHFAKGHHVKVCLLATQAPNHISLHACTQDLH